MDRAASATSGGDRTFADRKADQHLPAVPRNRCNLARHRWSAKPQADVLMLASVEPRLITDASAYS
jgi:hypothetical protein